MLKGHATEKAKDVVLVRREIFPSQLSKENNIGIKVTVEIDFVKQPVLLYFCKIQFLML
jgi:hypothetical protein